MTSTYRKKNKKVRRKLRKLTSIMPMLEWRPDISQQHMFRMPFNKTGEMKDLQLHTPIKSRKKKVWANVFQNLSHLPREIYMKDIQFGFIPKDHWHIVWVDTQRVLPVEDIKGLTLRGTAIQVMEWKNTYNPYVKFNKFVIDILRNNRRVQTSLPSIMQTYKDNGIWEEIKQIKTDIWNVTTNDNLMDLSYYFTRGCYSNGKKFVIPNPIKSLRICFDSAMRISFFNFLLSNETIHRHEMLKHIQKDLGLKHTINQFISDEEWDRDPILLEEDNPARSDGTRQEENDPF
jgi:hypothetical protein